MIGSENPQQFGFMTGVLQQKASNRTALSNATEPFSDRLPFVEGLRALGMSLVFWGHFANMFSPYLERGSTSSNLAAYFEVWGHRGISFFFVITGYFVYGKFLQAKGDYPAFVKKRLLRICPLYWSILILYLVLGAFIPAASKLPHGLGASTKYILENFFLLQGFIERPLISVSWAITYLVLAYVALPLLVVGLRMPSWSQRQRVAGIVFGSLLWLAFCYRCPVFSPRVVILAVGMLLYEALGRNRFLQTFSRKGEIGAVALWVLAMTLWFLADKKLLGFLPPLPLASFYRYLFLSIALFYTSAYAFGYDGFLKRFLSLKILRQIGKINYAFYLGHGLVLKATELAANTLLPPSYRSDLFFWGILPICYSAGIGTAWLLFAAVEQPFSRWYRKAPSRNGPSESVKETSRRNRHDCRHDEVHSTI